MIDKKTINKTINNLIKKYPNEKNRIKIGVNQVAKLWQKEDGNNKEFEKFCTENFDVGDKLEKIFERYNEKYEYIKGHLIALYLKLRIELDEDRGELLNIDRYFSNLNPLVHLSEDFFKSKISFLILLNFPISELKEIIKNMDKMTRKDWAINRMPKQFVSRIPSSISQKITEVESKASEFVYSYNIPMKNITDNKGNEIFNDLSLISHWGLRDQLKMMYPNNEVEKQKTIQILMERIINGEVPYRLIKEKKGLYNPYKNEYDGKKNNEIDYNRYNFIKEMFLAVKEGDGYNILYDNYIDRRFNLEREIPFEEAEKILKSVLESDAGIEVGKLIEKRLNRKLEVFDIWYNGFTSTNDNINLDDVVKSKFKTLDDFQNSIPEILKQLGFDDKTSLYLSQKIEVDPARGAGHAWGPEMKGEKAHLRTRAVDAKYMNWQAFNTAMHELGHCVEQVFTLYDVDYNLLSGVPNTAFTEAMAFMFQNKSFDILGIKRDEKHNILNSLQTLWDAREISGVALVDMYMWKWMYKKQKFTEKELREKVIEIAKDVWNKYYSEIFEIKNSPILAIYSHMILHSLYLFDYPLGHIIAYQIEKYFEDKTIGSDMKRICQLGSITPIKWMKEAVGNTISAKALTDDAKNAVKNLKGE